MVGNAHPTDVLSRHVNSKCDIEVTEEAIA